MQANEHSMHPAEQHGAFLINLPDLRTSADATKLLRRASANLLPSKSCRLQPKLPTPRGAGAVERDGGGEFGPHERSFRGAAPRGVVEGGSWWDGIHLFYSACGFTSAPKCVCEIFSASGIHAGFGLCHGPSTLFPACFSLPDLGMVPSGSFRCKARWTRWPCSPSGEAEGSGAEINPGDPDPSSHSSTWKLLEPWCKLPLSLRLAVCWHAA